MPKDEEIIARHEAMSQTEENAADVIISRVAAGALFGTAYGVGKCMWIKVEQLPYLNTKGSTSHRIY